MSGDDCVCCAGPVGPQGIPGVQGPAGPQGPNGSQGSTGVAGSQGIQGQVGPQGPVGAQGQQGPSGSQGPQGAPGQNGSNGTDGSQGPIGPMGPQGLVGPVGPAGSCVACPCSCEKPEYAEVYSITTQDLEPSPGPNLAGQTCILENTIVATSNIDVSQAAINGKITINRAGWYDVSTGISGALNPIPSPIPVWTLSLFKNGVIVPGSTFANQTISPEQKANEIVADVYVHFNVGDVLELSNTSTNFVFMSAPSFGTNAQTNSAYLKIVLLQAD